MHLELSNYDIQDEIRETIDCRSEMADKMFLGMELKVVSSA